MMINVIDQIRTFVAVAQICLITSLLSMCVCGWVSMCVCHPTHRFSRAPNGVNDPGDGAFCTEQTLVSSMELCMDSGVIEMETQKHFDGRSRWRVCSCVCRSAD